MNINIDIVARALNKAGEEPLTKEELETKKGTRWRLIEDTYLATILEELAAVSWTSQKRRARLEAAEEENLTSYMFMYVLPIDCAKPVGLNSEKVYLVEDGFLYTDDAEPILIYITNYFTGEEKEEDDYSFYDDPKFDPLLEDCIVTKLAMKLVLKLTGNTQLYQILYQDAIIMENRATKASEAHGHNKGKGNKSWGELMGLPSYGED